MDSLEYSPCIILGFAKRAASSSRGITQRRCSSSEVTQPTNTSGLRGNQRRVLAEVFLIPITRCHPARLPILVAHGQPGVSARLKPASGHMDNAPQQQ